MKAVKEKVFLGKDNTNSPVFLEDGVAVDFSAATRMTFEFGESGVIADSSVTAGIIDWSQGGGVVECTFGGLTIDEGEYLTKVTVYDPTHTNGQNLAHESGPALIFIFVDG